MILKDIIIKSVDDNVGTYMNLVQKLYDNPELGNEEFFAQKTLSEYLSSKGFEVETGKVVPTDFVAYYDSGNPGPKIAFMCEYDALPEVGHGCGHNLIAGIGVAAGEALKAVINETGGIVYVIGTPAEENFGGKVSMSEAGIFDEMDVAFMMHPGTETGLGGASSALYPLKFEFHGKNAHGCRAWQGASALDAAVMTFQGINMLRQFVKQGSYIHGIISDGGKAANVIPAYASLEYYFRADSIAYAKELAEKAIKIAEGQAIATGTTVTHSVYECAYEDTIINYTLTDILKNNLEELEVKEISPVKTEAEGSTDVGAVSYRCPVIQGHIKIAPDNVAGHSKELADATISDSGIQGLTVSAKALALSALDLLVDSQLLEKVKSEQTKALEQKK